MFVAVVGCNEEKKGACVVLDAPDSYCMEDQTDGFCSGSGYTFHENGSCSAAGYAYFCTPTDMRKSGSTIYGSSRYLRSSTCDARAGSNGGTSSSSSGGSSSGSSGTSSSGSSGTSSSGGSSSGNNGDDVPQSCNTQTVQGCTLTFCAGGGQGCYYVADGTKYQCASCNDITDCIQAATANCP